MTKIKRLCYIIQKFYNLFMFKINDKEIKQFERDLKTFAHRAYPFATKNTINKSAFQAQRFAKKDLKARLTLRNLFTVQSVQVDQAKTLRVARQAAVVGSTADYMEDQEFGTTLIKKGREGVSIPTSQSAGQGRSTKPRTRLPATVNKLKNIRLSKRPRQTKKHRQALVIAAQIAVHTGNRVVFLDLGRKKGIFRIIGGSRRSKRGWPEGARLRMLHDLTEQSVRIPRRPWLKPAVDRTVLLIPEFYRKALIFQLKRQNLFD